MDRVERTALISILINVGLVFLKVVLAGLSGSLALVADAWHSASDVAVSGLVLAGARISRRREGPNLAVVENIIGLIIGILILWAAIGIFRRVSAAAGSAITNLPVAIGGSLIAAVISYYASQYKLFVGRKTGSLSLIADGYHSRMDTLTTVAVVVGLMGHAIGVGLDRIAAVVVGLFVIESAAEILAASVGGLREGTVARPAVLARFLESRPVRALVDYCEKCGVAGKTRGLVSWTRRRANRNSLVGGAAGAVLLAWALSGIYFVGPGQAGVVLRWGRIHGGVRPPGIHYRAPWPVDRLTRLAVSEVRRIEVGFRTREIPRAVTRVAAEFFATLWESRHAAGAYEKHPEEALRLSGDENIVDVNLVVLYQVRDPVAYLFNAAKTDSLVRFSAEWVVSVVCGRLSIDDILMAQREELELALVSSLQDFLDESSAGVEVVGVRLQDMHPPLEVVPAFRDVSSAREDKERIINEAVAYKNEIVPRARGEAEKIKREGEAYRTERVKRALGDADRLVAMAAEYGKARAVNEHRLYIETMESVLTDVEKFIISSNIDVRAYDIRIFDKRLGTGAETQISK